MDLDPAQQPGYLYDHHAVFLLFHRLHLGEDLGNVPVHIVYRKRAALYDHRSVHPLFYHGRPLHDDGSGGNGLFHLLYQHIHPAGLRRHVPGYAGAVLVHLPVKDQMAGDLVRGTDHL